jgi:exosome complex RNA-binding protein Rrp4
MNGSVWVNSEEVKNTILISNAIQNSEYLSAEQCKQMVEGLVNKLEKKKKKKKRVLYIHPSILYII